MKRFLSLFVALSVVGTMFCSADELNLAQLRLRGDIKNFIQQEGYMPEIDEDGDIKFKKEGETFYVMVNSSDVSPMYVVLSKSFNNPEGYSPQAIKLAASQLNFYKGVKVLCFEKSFSIRAELYLTSADAFKESFSKLVKQIINVEEDVMDEIKKASNEGAGGAASSSFVPFMVTKLEVADVDYDGNIQQGYGSTIYAYKTKYLKPRITVTPMMGNGDYTVYVKLFKDGELKTGNTSPTGYSFSSKVTVSGTSSQTFYLSGWGSNTAGHWPAGSYRFEVWYGDYCVGSKDFKVY